ncbi:MAG TPA: phage head closure protein [Gemmatimonadales bacterium]|nr:phage head closure protein [Gemmatimonadales bacterium]
MQAGKLRHQIAIQQATEGQNARGEVTLTWPGTTLATVRAERLETAGGEGITADQLVATRTVTFRIRYRRDVKAKMRVVEGSRVFDIKVPNDPTGRSRKLDLLCVEVGV